MQRNPGAAAPRGRGAGINKPAWLVQQEREAAALGSAPSSDEVPGVPGDNAAAKRDSGENNVGTTEERDQFGRAGRSSNTREYDDRRSRSHDHHRSSRGGSHDRHHRYGSSGGGYDRHHHRGGGRRDRNYHHRSGRSDRGGGSGRSSGISFHSYEEERAWLEERRRKRHARKSLFDVEPSPEQLAEEEARAVMERDHLMMTGGMGMGAALTSATSSGGGGGMRSDGSSRGGGGLQSQQTRHARRLYIGNVPDINESDVHNFFRDAIRSAIILDPNNPNPSHQKQYVDNDPIISVYINRERRFAFLEFKTMEITTACLDLDGINVMGHGKVTIKRPNDYNPAWAPPVNPATLPKLDTAKLGIVSSTVVDGPNKIFIGGLPYHLTESQVLELLGAFGTVKAFHLVKSDPTAVTSKGYCFVEYADPNLTQVACMGLNGMDMGGGKQLSCRMAVQGMADNSGLAAMQTGGGAFAAPVAAPPAAATMVDGVDVDALLNAALGGGGVGAAAATTLPAAAPVMQMNPMSMMQPQQQAAVDPLAVANMLDAALGGTSAPAGGAVGGLPPQPVPAASQATRVLVLLNMVMDEDLANDEDYKMLEVEVRDEVGKYGRLLSMKIPRPQDGCAPSAVKKIFLEYATAADAMNAEKELKGRAFGPNVVDASYFSEDSYARNALS